MKITQVKLGRISTPLRVPFKTALRTVNSVEDVIVELHTDTGAVGYGEAPPTGVITGDTTGAILGAIQDHIAPAILGRDLDEFEDLTAAVQKALVHNTSAKAAVDMALWDLLGRNTTPRFTGCWAVPGRTSSPTSPSASTPRRRWPGMPAPLSSAATTA